MHGPKTHILATVQPAWEQIEATFGSKFWLYLANSGLPCKITVLVLLQLCKEYSCSKFSGIKRARKLDDKPIYI